MERGAGAFPIASRHPEEIGRGAVFQLPARWPYEETVEFMLAELPPSTDHRVGLIVTTGYKAGL
ncbi:Imm45 family immunity protein [Streptomyces anulatus]